MTEVSSRDDVARARRSDPQTSHDAAASVTGLRARQQAVLEVLRRWDGGMTDIQLINAYRSSPTAPAQSESGIRTRRRELVDLGYVRSTGRTKLLPSGRRGTIWAAVPPGQVPTSRPRPQLSAAKARAALKEALAGLDEIEECLNEAAAEDREEVGVDIRDILEGVADRLDKLLRD